MARILISHFSGININGKYQSGVFYDGLIESLIEQGNDVMQFVTSDCNIYWNGDNNPLNNWIKEATLKEIKKFNPELIISFNNSSMQDVENTVDCPIVLWDADKANFFCAKDKIKANPDRYIYFAFTRTGAEEYKSLFGIEDKDIYLVLQATNVKAAKLEKKYNISFIGTPFFNRSILVKAIAEQPELYNESYSDNSQALADKLKKYDIFPAELSHMHACSKRAKIISLLSELECHVWGPSQWLDLATCVIEIAKCYHSERVYSLQHNQMIYNQTKISVNICHAQNIEGYPWRISDILASNSVLLSDYKQDLVDHFHDKINLQMYDSPADAYNKAKKLLADDSLCADIIAQSNAAIDESFRWHHRFKIFQQATGVNLMNTGKPGSYSRLTLPLEDPEKFDNIFKYAYFINPKLRKIIKIFVPEYIRYAYTKYITKKDLKEKSYV